MVEIFSVEIFTAEIFTAEIFTAEIFTAEPSLRSLHCGAFTAEPSLRTLTADLQRGNCPSRLPYGGELAADSARMA